MNHLQKAIAEYQTTVRKVKISEGQRAILKGIPILSESGDYSELVEEAFALQSPLEATGENAKKLMATINKMSEAVNKIKRNK